MALAAGALISGPERLFPIMAGAAVFALQQAQHGHGISPVRDSASRLEGAGVAGAAIHTGLLVRFVTEDNGRLLICISVNDAFIDRHGGNGVTVEEQRAHDQQGKGQG